MKISYALVAIAAAAGSAMPAIAQQQQHDKSIIIENAWARATPPMVPTGAAYLTIRNTSQSADRLVATESPVAATVEVHNHIMDGNVMRMRKVDGIDLGPGSRIELKPGGYHVMFIGLKTPFKEGETVPLTLTFEKAGKIEISAPVRAMGSMGRGGGMGGHGPSGHGGGMGH